MEANAGVVPGMASARSGRLPIMAGMATRSTGGASDVSALRLATNSVTADDRVDWWCDQLNQHFGLECWLEPDRQHPFHIDLALTHFGTMTLIESGGSPLRLRHRGNSGSGRVFLQLQQEGAWHLGDSSGSNASRVDPDSLVLIHVRDDAAYTTFGAFRQTGIMFDEAALTDLCPRWQRFAFRPMPADRGLAAMVRTHLLSLTAQVRTIGCHDASSLAAPTLALISAWLGSLDNEPHAEIPGLPDFHRRRVKEFILNNLCDPLLTVERVAQAVGLSVRYVHKLFESESTGLMHWAIAKRLEYCRQRLADPRYANRRVSDIAYEAGFNDMAHFSRSFRRQFGTSPTQARPGSSAHAAG